MNPVVFSTAGSEALALRIGECLRAQVVLSRWGAAQPFTGHEVTRADIRDRDVIVIRGASLDEESLPIILNRLADSIRGESPKSVGLVIPCSECPNTKRHIVHACVDWTVTLGPLRDARVEGESPTPRRLFVSPLSSIIGWLKANVDSPLLVSLDRPLRRDGEEVTIPHEIPHLSIYDVYNVLSYGSTDQGCGTQSISQMTPVVLGMTAHDVREVTAMVGDLRHAGMRRPMCVLVHAVGMESRHRELQQVGCQAIITTNSVPHASNRVDIAPAISDAVRQVLNKRPTLQLRSLHR